MYYYILITVIIVNEIQYNTSVTRAARTLPWEGTALAGPGMAVGPDFSTRENFARNWPDVPRESTGTSSGE